MVYSCINLKHFWMIVWMCQALEDMDGLDEILARQILGQLGVVVHHAVK